MDGLFAWIWQGLVVALAATAVLRLARQFDAASRCRLWWTALLAVAALGLVTWLCANPTTPEAAGVFALASLDPVLVEASATGRTSVSTRPAAGAPTPPAVDEASVPGGQDPSQPLTTDRSGRRRVAPRTASDRSASRSPEPVAGAAGSQPAPRSATMVGRPDPGLSGEAALASVLLPPAREWPGVTTLLTALTDPPTGEPPLDGGRDRWAGTTEAGARIGAGARQAAFATSGYVTRFAKSVARAF